MTLFRMTRGLLVMFVITAASVLNAQFTIEQTESIIPVNYDLMPEDTEFGSIVEEARYFLGMPEEKLISAALSGGFEIESDKATYYMDGNNFALDTESPEEGKMTIISDYGKGTMYYVLWDRQIVIETSKEEMEAMQKESAAVAEKMMQNMSPEIRAQMEAMKAEQKTAPREKVLPTGRKAKKNGFDCQEYMIEGEETVTVIWATDDVYGLSEKIRQNAEKMAGIFQTDNEDEEDEWEYVKGKVPIETRTFTMGMAGSPEIEISIINSITQAKPPAEKFAIPSEAQGFTRGTMKDLFQPMMDMYKDFDQDEEE